MGNITAGQIWPVVLAVASAIVLLSNAVEKIANAVRAAKAPGAKQDERLLALEQWRKEVDEKLKHDHARFERLDDGNRVTQRALIALLDHGIDGNNIKQMQDAKEDLQTHLINR